MLTSRIIDTNESYHALGEWSDSESMELREPDNTATIEEYALHSIYAQESDGPSEPTVAAPTKEQLEAARKEIKESKKRIDERLSGIEKTLSESNQLLGCTKKFEDKFNRASKGGRI